MVHEELNKGPDVVRVLLPPDANSLLVALDERLGGRIRIDVIVAGKQPEPQYLWLGWSPQR